MILFGYYKYFIKIESVVVDDFDSFKFMSLDSNFVYIYKVVILIVKVVILIVKVLVLLIKFVIFSIIEFTDKENSTIIPLYS